MKVKLVVVGGVDEFHLTLTKAEMAMLAHVEWADSLFDEMAEELDAAYGESGW